MKYMANAQWQTTDSLVLFEGQIESKALEWELCGLIKWNQLIDWPSGSKLLMDW